MKKLILISLLIAAPAFAQVPPSAPPDPVAQLNVSQQLLGEANNRVVTALAQVQALEGKVRELTAENAKLKAGDHKPAEPGASAPLAPPAPSAPPKK